MSAESINYYYSGSNLPNDIWQVFYDFNSLVGNYLPSVTGSTQLLSGLVVGGSIYCDNSSGYFAGDSYVEIKNITGDLSDWTIVCSFERNSITDGIIFSNFTSGAINSGFVLGVTASNRLYAESWDETGPVVLISPSILGAKNIVSFTKIGQSIYLDYLNGNSKEVESHKFEVSDKSFLNSNKWYLGGAPLAPESFSGNIFSGVMDNFILLDSPVRPEEIKDIFKGIYSTGTLPQENLPYIRSLGMNHISFLVPINGQDTFEMYADATGHNSTGLNRDAIYDRAVGEFFASVTMGSGVLGFLNGVAQFGHRGYSVGGTFYNNTYSLTGNYVPSGFQFFSNDTFNGLDRLTYDLDYLIPFTGYTYSIGFSHDGSASQLVSSLGSPTSDLVFLDGVKLIYNIDYIASGSSVAFLSGNALYDGASGLLMVYPKNSSVSQLLTGTNNLYTLSSACFARNTSQVWLNGIRQNLDESYIEISKIDTLYNTGLYLDYNQTLFLNT